MAPMESWTGQAGGDSEVVGPRAFAIRLFVTKMSVIVCSFFVPVYRTRLVVVIYEISTAECTLSAEMITEYQLK